MFLFKEYLQSDYFRYNSEYSNVSYHLKKKHLMNE